MSERETAGPAAEPFLGAPWRSASAGGFAVALWFADRFGDAIEEHEHEHAHLMIVLSGRYHSRAAGAECDARPMIVNPPKTCHRDRFLTPGSFMSIAISATQWSVLDGERAAEHPLCLSGRGAHGLVAKLMRELASAEPDESLMQESLCTELCGLASTPARAERRRPPWLDRAIEMLTCDLACDIGLADVARTIGIHPYHMTRTFRAFERCTPGEFLAAARLRRAAELLSATRVSLAEVAIACGFADQSHLTRRFRDSYGVTPGAYRRCAAIHSR